MALYSDLPIYKHGCDLLSLALDVQVQLPRVFKRSLGEKIHGKCVDMLEAMTKPPLPMCCASVGMRSRVI